MAEASLKLGGDWATKEGSLLGFNDQNGNYKPIPFDFTRATTATRVNRDGLIEEVQAGVPRIDFSSGDGSLLLEPQRTNLITYSEDFTQAAWTKTGSGLGTAPVLTSNYGISPDGTQNASRLQMNLNGGTAGSDISYLSFFISSISSAANSVYLKSLDGNVTMTFRCGSTFKSIIVTNEWQRFNVVDASGTDRFQVLLYGNSDSQSADLLIYGAQLEAGSYATSYIKTSGSAVTRNADNTVVTSADDLIGQTEGTMFFEGSVEHTPENVSIMNFDRSTQYSVVLLKATNGKINAFVFNGGLVTIQIISEAISGKFKCAVAYKSGDTAFYVNGTQIGVNTTTFTPAATLDEIYIGSYSSPYFAFDHPVECNQALVFKTRLTNEELAALTTI